MGPPSSALARLRVGPRSRALPAIDPRPSADSSLGPIADPHRNLPTLVSHSHVNLQGRCTESSMQDTRPALHSWP
eukprot:2996123-Rhodomonas_salina.3